ncbi:hypothetical protein JR065_08935 [Xanthomonas sp. AmX2]|uniref:hypothetical protein n=1 Tax=Xanthomonas sp. TaxID=29446 RepID=UPI00197F0D69|nr:hypothetical protein [Xanthomonas sp.]MBN6150465.1 hypothetical protein [Xanthomonas sp.]
MPLFEAKILPNSTMSHTYYSQRIGTNPNLSGLPLPDVIGLFIRVFDQLRNEGYFHESFGYECVDAGDIQGLVKDIELEMLLTIRKKHLWPMHENAKIYTEDDFFDMVEFLYQHVSKPIDGDYHGYGDCGMHWNTFNKMQGQAEYRNRVNTVLAHYVKAFEVSPNGEVLQKPEAGFEQIFDADIPAKDANVAERLKAAILRYRRHGSTIDDRRQAVRDLADVLEYLRPRVKSLLTSSDERDLFNIANNFGIRHHNDQQKTGYDASIWLSWMFYFYLATIHVVMRKIDKQGR